MSTLRRIHSSLSRAPVWTGSDLGYCAPRRPDPSSTSMHRKVYLPARVVKDSKRGPQTEWLLCVTRLVGDEQHPLLITSFVLAPYSFRVRAEQSLMNETAHVHSVA